MDSTEENEKGNEKKREENKKNMENLLQEFPTLRDVIESNKKSRDILNSIKPNLADSFIASMYMFPTLIDLYSSPMLLSLEMGKKSYDKILRMGREIENRCLGMILTMTEFDKIIKQESPAFPSAIELRKIPNLDTYPDSYSGILRATNAYIEAIEKQLEKEISEKKDLLRIIENLKKGSKEIYIA